MTNKTNPTVCILMATYNGEAYIAEQVESIQEQSFGDWQLIVSDDGSTDNTIAILNRYAKDDPRIIILEGLAPTGSAKDNFTRLVHYASAPYVMFCDQDDVWLKHKVEITLDAMRKEESAQGRKVPTLVFTDMEVVDRDLRLIEPSFTRRSHINPSRRKFMQVVAQSLGAGCTMMANMSLIELFRQSPADSRIIMHDWWLSLLAAAFGKIVYIDEPTSMYRQHESNSVGSSDFDPLENAKHIDVMWDRIMLTVNQAACFQEEYSAKLLPKDRDCLDLYVHIPVNKNRFRRLVKLLRSRGWKGGLRRIGQIATIVVHK